MTHFPRIITLHLVSSLEGLIVPGIIRLKLANEPRLSIITILLGEGTRFFDDTGPEQALHLKNTTAYRNGMVEPVYEMKK